MVDAKVENLQAELDQEIIEIDNQAEIEIEAIRIQAEAIKNAGGEEYVRLKAIEKWNGVLPTTMAGQSVPFVNLTK